MREKKRKIFPLFLFFFLSSCFENTAALRRQPEVCNSSTILLWGEWRVSREKVRGDVPGECGFPALGSALGYHN